MSSLGFIVASLVLVLVAIMVEGVKRAVRQARIDAEAVAWQRHTQGWGD